MTVLYVGMSASQIGFVENVGDMVAVTFKN